MAEIRHWNCKCCGSSWELDRVGLVPDYCLMHPVWYGVWIPRPKEEWYVEGEMGCPTCHSGNWKFVDNVRNPHVVDNVDNTESNAS